MKTELEKFIEWIEGYNEFCYDNSKDLVFDTFGENKVLSESAKKFYSQGLAIERILTRVKEKKLIETQKDECLRFVSWLCNTNKVYEILDKDKTEKELYEQWISKS
jgi:hypothetical protein